MAREYWSSEYDVSSALPAALVPWGLWVYLDAGEGRRREGAPWGVVLGKTTDGVHGCVLFASRPCVYQVKSIYRRELRSSAVVPGARSGLDGGSRLQLLELSMYLENYLWPNFKPEVSSKEHLMSTVREGQIARGDLTG